MQTKIYLERYSTIVGMVNNLFRLTNWIGVMNLEPLHISSRVNQKNKRFMKQKTHFFLYYKMHSTLLLIDFTTMFLVSADSGSLFCCCHLIEIAITNIFQLKLHLSNEPTVYTIYSLASKLCTRRYYKSIRLY